MVILALACRFVAVPCEAAAGAPVRNIWSARVGATRNLPTVAVLDFRANNTAREEADMLSQFVRSAMVKSRVFAVVDKQNMDKVLAEQAFQQMGCGVGECAVKLGKVLNVRTVLVGSFTFFGGRRFVSGQLVDVETGQIISSESENVRDVSHAESAAKDLVGKLIAALEPAARGVSVMFEEPPREESSWKWLTYGAILAGAFVAMIVLI